MFPLDPLPAARRAVALARRDQFVPLDDGPVGDLVREALAEGLPAWVQAREGYLYLAANPGVENLYKIGRARGSVEKRMKSLNDAGVLVPWQAVAVWRVYDAAGLEAQAHAACAEFRVKNELFQATWGELTGRIQACLAQDAARMGRYLEMFYPMDSAHYPMSPTLMSETSALG